jgi:hypothetical protein
MDREASRFASNDRGYTRVATDTLAITADDKGSSVATGRRAIVLRLMDA